MIARGAKDVFARSLVRIYTRSSFGMLAGTDAGKWCDTFCEMVWTWTSATIPSAVNYGAGCSAADGYILHIQDRMHRKAVVASSSHVVEGEYKIDQID